MPNGQTSAAKGGGGEAARGARDVVERAVDGWIRERLLEAGCVKVRPQNLGSSGGLGNFTAVEASAICNFETAKQRADGWSGAGKPRQGANASTSTSTANARGCSTVRCEGGGSSVEGGGVGWMRVCVWEWSGSWNRHAPGGGAVKCASLRSVSCHRRKRLKS
jgi:hypothetical protein